MAISYSNLALNLNAQDRHKEAEILLQKALEISQRTLGKEHPNTITIKNNYEMLLSEQKSRLTEE